ncbi:MAG: hypothetical protein R3D25_11290 [Geminicoccaceae bacterium]
MLLERALTVVDFLSEHELAAGAGHELAADDDADVVDPVDAVLWKGCT